MQLYGKAEEVGNKILEAFQSGSIPKPSHLFTSSERRTSHVGVGPGTINYLSL
jgi:hypothetical protein